MLYGTSNVCISRSLFSLYGKAYVHASKAGQDFNIVYTITYVVHYLGRSHFVWLSEC